MLSQCPQLLSIYKLLLYELVCFHGCLCALLCVDMACKCALLFEVNPNLSPHTAALHTCNEY